MVKNRQRKAKLFVEHLSDPFSPHNDDHNQEVEQDLAIPTQFEVRLKVFSLKEIKDEVITLNQKRHQVSTS
jgi:hypothetical protein